METCKAIVQEGKRKGECCKFPPNESLYCGRHARNKIYDEGLANGIKWCRFFFRGCDSQLEGAESSCAKCRQAISKKTIACGHEGCTFKIIEGKFCKKHERDTYRLEEMEKGIKYCDINRGCFTLVTDKNTCEECLEKTRLIDNERHNKKKELFVAATKSGTTRRTCVGCSTEFEAFNTRYSNESYNCKECLKKQASQDIKRAHIKRNYKEEHFRHLESYYKDYITNSLTRGYGDFQLSFTQFTELVKNPCHYCKQLTEGEINGIDRVNNDLGYTTENTVTACWTCNRMKSFYHPQFFIEKCKIISKQFIPNKEFYQKWSLYYTRSNYKNYTNYKKEAEKRGLPFEITQQQWDWTTRSPCYLCGYQDAHGIGLDRLDNTIRKYTVENCRPCCGSCNNMKNEIILADLLDYSKQISDAWDTSAFSSIPITKNPLKEAEKKGITSFENRKHWKSEGLYYAILSNNAEHFFNANKDILSDDEYTILCETIVNSEKGLALDILKKLLVKLKKRKLRIKHRQESREQTRDSPHTA